MLKKFCLIFAGFLIVASFWNPLVKLFFRLYYQCEFDFRAIAWKGGAICVEDLVWVDVDGAFSLRVPEAKWFLQERSLELDAAEIVVYALTASRLSFDGAVVIREGTIEWPGAGRATLALDWKNHGGTIDFACAGGTASLDVDPTSIQLELHEWPASTFTPFLEVASGSLNGTLEIQADHRQIDGHLAIANVCLPGYVEALFGTISYHSDVGSKWELRGTGYLQEEKIPLMLEGRTYLKSELSNWIEADLQVGEDLCLHFAGHEEGTAPVWSVERRDGGVSQVVLQGQGSWESWKAEAAVWGAPFDVRGGYQNGALSLQGEWEIGEGFKVRCPLFVWRGKGVDFDFRLEGPMWDFARCKGSYEHGQMQLDPKSHCLGEPLHWDGSVCRGTLPWKTLLVAGQHLWPGQVAQIPLEGSLSLQLSKNQFTLSNPDLKWKGVSTPVVTASFSASGKANATFCLSGAMQGEGHVSWGDRFEVDLDLAPISLKELETTSLTHLFYAPQEGVLIHGLNLALPIHCKADLFHLNPTSLHWDLGGARAYLEGIFDGTADLHWNGERFICEIQDGLVPIWQETIHIQNGLVEWDGKTGSGSVYALHQGHRFQVLFEATLDQGRCMIQEKPVDRPLVVEWNYDPLRGVALRSMEGRLSGLDLSFRAALPYEDLLGSARVDFSILSDLIPPVIDEVFHDLEMGKGYELKGRLTQQGQFQGILAGKGQELFGFELQTLLAQVYLSLTKVHLTGIEVSDRAGRLKIDEILMQEPSPDAPWTIDIPHLTITELRPSLLKKLPDRKESPLTPLVVRELHIDDLKGFLKDTATYTAQGELFFINSFRREFSLLDLPADILSRIVGLDLELLIPVKGTLTYILKDGFFQLQELKDAFSEAHRSEFFLMPEPIPSMDFNGNLRIFIKMKQYVLFKLTESFLISIDGNLSNPKYHLQKRR